MFFLQTVDIDLNGFSWTPIGKDYYLYQVSFRGTYDGNNLSIINVRAYSDTEYAGLFGYIDCATIKNLNVYYNGSSYASDPPFDDENPDNYLSDNYYGGIAGFAYESSIENCSVYDFNVSYGFGAYPVFIGGVVGYGVREVIHNCEVNRMTLDIPYGNPTELVVGGVIGYGYDIADCLVTDLSFSIQGDGGTCYIGGIAGQINHGEISNVTTSGLITCSFGVDHNSGGAIGYMDESTLENIVSNVDIAISSSQYACIGGIFGVGWGTTSVTRCIYTGTISGTVNLKNTTNSSYIGGLCGFYRETLTISECSFDGIIDISNSADSTIVKGVAYIGGLGGCDNNSSSDSVLIQYCTINGTISFKNCSTSAQYCASVCSYICNGTFTIQNTIINCSIALSKLSGASTTTNGVYYASKGSSATTTITNCYYNSTLYGSSSATISLTSAQMRDRSSFSSMTEFDDYFIYVKNRNNDFPILQVFLRSAKVTGFDGSGTQADPYQIKTTADLQGMQAYYNEYDLIDEYWWILMNDIDISVDANGLTINWCPIGYEGGVVSGFNGYFDGNEKTISGLTITEQYENVGLFGRLASNATITNLNISGTINWDQAKYVGGVVGLMQDGATLTGCTFNGTITGYLNSGNIAVVGGLAGKYSADAITGSTNYDCYVYGTDNYTTFNRFNSTYAIV